MFSEEISKARLDKIRGVERHDRLDAELFNDFESEDQRKVILKNMLLYAALDSAYK